MNFATRKFTQLATKSPLGASGFLETNTSEGSGVMFAGGCCVHQPRTGRVHCMNDSSPPPGYCRTDSVLHRTREQIRTYQILVTVDDFPRFLWEGEQVDPQDMNAGFLRGELLVKVRIPFHVMFETYSRLSLTFTEFRQVLLSVMIGPAAARPGGKSSGVGGYADILGIHSMTIPSLAFAAIAVGSFGNCSGTSLLIFGRHVMPFLLTHHATGRSRAVRRGSTTYRSTTGSSRPSNPGGKKTNGRFSVGGISTSPYLSRQNFLLTMMQQEGPLTCSWRRSRNATQQRSRARFSGCNDDATSGRPGCWVPLRHR